MQQRFEVLEVFSVVAILYLAMTTCWDWVQRRIERHYAKAYGQIETAQLARDDR
jgi:polar amino acid transport system permease protein